MVYKVVGSVHSSREEAKVWPWEYLTVQELLVSDIDLVSVLYETFLDCFVSSSLNSSSLDTVARASLEL